MNTTVAQARQANAMTEAQERFLRKLMGERVIDAALKEDIDYELEQPSGPTRAGVSSLIDDLLKAPFKASHQTKYGPKQQALPEVPAGYYAIEDAAGKLRFVRVDRPTEGAWAGWTFVKIQAGDEFHRLRGDQPRKALERILEAGVEAASRRYGREIGSCGVCGRTLTDESSRAAGIGPVCLANVGWSA